MSLSQLSQFTPTSYSLIQLSFSKRKEPTPAQHIFHKRQRSGTWIKTTTQSSSCLWLFLGVKSSYSRDEIFHELHSFELIFPAVLDVQGRWRRDASTRTKVRKIIKPHHVGGLAFEFVSWYVFFIRVEYFYFNLVGTQRKCCCGAWKTNQTQFCVGSDSQWVRRTLNYAQIDNTSVNKLHLLTSTFSW